MDINNYPIHLTTAELEYELSIRGSPDLPTHRLKTVALKEFLVKEHNGLAEAPKRCNHNTDNEIKLCSAIFEDAVNKAEEAIQSGTSAELPRCASRLIHVQSRLERLTPIEEGTCTRINDLFDGVYEALTRVVCAIHVPPLKQSRETRRVSGRASLVLPPPKFIALSDGARQPTRVSFRSSVPEPTFEQRLDNLNLEDTDEEEEGAVGGLANLAPNKSLHEIEQLTSAERIEITQLLNDTITNPFITRDYNEQPTRRRPIETERSVNKSMPVASHHQVNPNRFEELSFDQPTIGTSAQNPTPSAGAHGHRLRDFVPYRGTRKSVPINQWGISFSGEGTGTHLYDFLSQVSLFQRSEGVSDDEMVYSIVHLLAGRAKLWYISVCDQFEGWAQIVYAMKREFLPENYDFLLFTDINNRVQKENESFGEYMTHMLALFKCLSLPLDEGHRLFIVRKNLLPRYALAIAPLSLRNLSDLNAACRRIDNATSLTNRHAFSMPFSPERPEIFAVQQQQGASPHPPWRGQSTMRQTCWNCQATGHSHATCPHPKTGVFCYKCGLRGAITSRCGKCAGNGNANPAVGGPAQDSGSSN